MTMTPERLVEQNVIACFSGLVSALARGVGDISPHLSEIAELSEEALELCYPVTDYEEAAIQGGWIFHPGDDGIDGVWTRGPVPIVSDETQVAYSPEEACEHDGLEPYEREILEHWAVSDWLARRLAIFGERVGPFGDFMVWGRTCSGQVIACDYVIRQIVDDANSA
jgi:hypothetical protein